MVRTCGIAAAIMLATPCSGDAQRLSRADSVSLRANLQDQAFLFLMDWRYEWWVDRGDMAFETPAWVVAPKLSLDELVDMLDSTDVADSLADSTFARLDPIFGGRRRPDSVRSNEPILNDFAALKARAYQVAIESERLGSFGVSGGGWDPVYRTPRIDPRRVDANFSPGLQTELKQRRKKLIAALDAGARRLPGDPWIAGQRVRMNVDQSLPTQAMAAARECRAARWWCTALRGYVWYMMDDPKRAGAAFDSSLAVAPDSVVCAWNDLAPLLSPAGAQVLRHLGCVDVERERLTETIWWLADPLFLEPGNERRTEHYGRTMLVTLRTMVDSVDGIFDYRNGNARRRYEGATSNAGRPLIPIQEKILRWGYPIATRGCFVCPGVDSLAGPAFVRAITNPERAPVQRWRRLDTKSVYLGVYSTYRWIGPGYHTIPSWAAIAEPYLAVPEDWSLGPPLRAADDWTAGWWPPEFYLRKRGPLFPLPTQIAFFRRASTAVLAAAAEWNRLATFRAAPRSAVFGLALTSAPHDTMLVVAQKITGDRPPTLTTPVPSRGAILGIELIPTTDMEDGAASRSRFGVTPPPPLSKLLRGTIAISDPVLVRLDSVQSEPVTMDEVLKRMLGSTDLRNPSRVAVAWESYGIADGDTVDVAVRIIHRTEARRAPRLLSVLGFGNVGDDSLVISWRTPRSSDRPATYVGGHPVRLESLALDLSALPGGRYVLEIVMERRGAPRAMQQRPFTIVR